MSKVADAEVLLQLSRISGNQSSMLSFGPTWTPGDGEFAILPEMERRWYE
jgi:hypothetical protein